MKLTTFLKFVILLCFYTNIFLVKAGPTSHARGNDLPLYLSPYITSMKTEEGRKLAEVKDLGWNIKSYSGLLTVNETLGSNMFFWYLPAQSRPERAPLLLWLNGYSTASSYGLFLQNGPFDLLDSTNLRPRNASWQKYYHVLYIDNPVGVGFSTTESEEGYSINFNDIGNNLYAALNQFMELFPEVKPNDFYITGLSLAGKYSMALANIINRENKNNSINFKGIFLGNPLLNPEVQISNGEYLFQLGFIQENEKADLKNHEEIVKEDLHHKNYESFVKNFWTYLGNIQKITGLNSVFDYNSPYVDPRHYEAYMSSKEVRQALHVGNIPFDDGAKAMTKAGEIIGMSVTNIMEELLEKINILIYVGQMDLVCHYPMVAKVLSSLHWSGQQGYIDAKRLKLYNDKGNYVWGYKRNYGRLTDVLIRNGSHSVISSQPENVLNLLLNFTNYNQMDT